MSFWVLSFLAATALGADFHITISGTSGGSAPGPWVSTPFQNTNIPEINEAAAIASITGDPARLNAVLGKYEAGANGNAAGYTPEQKELLGKLIGASLHEGELRLSEAKLPQPVPEAADPGLIRRFREEMVGAQSKGAQDPLAFNREIERQRVSARAFSRSYRLSERATGAYLEAELKRLYFDEQGLLKNVPYARAPQDPLISSAASPEGWAIRAGLNRVLVSESVLRARLAQTPGVDVAGLDEVVAATELAYQLADRMAAIEDARGFETLIAAANAGADFLQGFAQGVIDGSVDLATGLANLVAHPIDSVRSIIEGVSYAYQNWPAVREKLSAFAGEKIDILLYGTAEARGELLGRGAFEVGGLLIPAGAAGAAAKTVIQGFGRVAIKVAIETSLARAAIDGALAGSRLLSEAGPSLSRWGAAFPEQTANFMSARGTLGSALEIIPKIDERGLSRMRALEKSALGVPIGKTSERLYNPTQPGHLHLLKLDSSGVRVATTFRSGTYRAVLSDSPRKFYRVQPEAPIVGGKLSRFWTSVSPEGPVQAILDSAIDPRWGNNTGLNWVEIEVPPGVVTYEGFAASQGALTGGGPQVFIENLDPSWLKNFGTFRGD